jgi:hypothetical protein
VGGDYNDWCLIKRLVEINFDPTGSFCGDQVARPILFNPAISVNRATRYPLRKISESLGRSGGRSILCPVLCRLLASVLTFCVACFAVADAVKVAVIKEAITVATAVSLQQRQSVGFL